MANLLHALERSFTLFHFYLLRPRGRLTSKLQEERTSTEGGDGNENNEMTVLIKYEIFGGELVGYRRDNLGEELPLRRPDKIGLPIVLDQLLQLIFAAQGNNADWSCFQVYKIFSSISTFRRKRK